ncbi:hypothetical protein [Burkholderia gladioli]|uniref:hypothetical protein n=1 Tax=Burkholderia gladioli TaxID=28095 RepID=UPI00163E2706|nr:hypothetical protein [Burkholderia gladioli]
MTQQNIPTPIRERLEQQDMQLTVLRSAFVLLVRQLDQAGLLRSSDLQSDLLLMAETQPDEDWRYGHTLLAGLLYGADGRS